MVDAPPNLRILRPSRKLPRPGDVFALSPMEHLFLFGRVIATDAVVGPIEGCILIYVYRDRSHSAGKSDRSLLRPDRLLLPPILTNRLPWSRGYFETVAHYDLTETEVLPIHCFRNWNGEYYDECGNELQGPVEPVGDRGLHSFRTIDDLVSRALGLHPAPG